MVKNLGFGTTDSTKLLFGGCTPGAIYNLDLVPEVLKSLGVKEDMVSVQGLFDSAAVLDLEPLSPSTLSLANMTAQAYEYVGAAWTANSACLADNGQEPWRCMLGSTLLSYVQTPYLLVQSKYDRAQLMYNAPHPGRGNASLQYADEFGAASAALLRTLPTAAQASKSALFASACFSYCTSLSGMFWNTAVNGVAPQKVAGATLPGKAQPPVSLQTVVDWWFFKDMVRTVVVWAAYCTPLACALLPCGPQACFELTRSVLTPLSRFRKMCASLTTASASGAASATPTWRPRTQSRRARRARSSAP